MKLFCDYNRFDLEQDIIKAWGVVEMIDELVRQHLDRPDGGFTEDELANRLDAIKYVTDMNFQRLWDGFEVMIKKDRFEKVYAVPDKPKKGNKKWLT